MSDVQISLVLPSTNWIMGLPFHATVRLTNAGSTPVEVPTTLSPSEFEFRVTSVERQEAQVLSARMRRFSRRPDPAPVPRFVMPLAPGATSEYTENLGDYASPPLAAGRYQVKVRWTRGSPGADTSAAQDAVVMVPRPRALVPLGDADGTLAVLWAGQANGAAAQVLLREGTRMQPAEGVSNPVGALQGDGVAGLALSPSIAPGAPTRWCAWLDGDMVHAGIVQGATVLAKAGPAALGLQSAGLCGSVWPLGEASAVLLALGFAPPTGAQIAVAQATADEPIVLQRGDLPLAAAPRWWAAQRTAASDGFRCVSVVADAAGTTVQVHRIALDGRCLASTTLVHRGEPFQAGGLAAVCPQASNDAGFVDLLFGPGGSPPRLTYLRLPLNGGMPLAEIPVPVPRNAAGQLASDWTLACADATPPRLIARMGDQIIGKVLSPTGRGFVVAADAAGARDLRLEQVGEDWWAIWIDPGAGLRFARLPDVT